MRESDNRQVASSRPTALRPNWTGITGWALILAALLMLAAFVTGHGAGWPFLAIPAGMAGALLVSAALDRSHDG